MYKGYDSIMTQYPTLADYCNSIQNAEKNRIVLERVTIEYSIDQWCGNINRRIPQGNYIMLYVGCSIMMSDTPAEIDDMYSIFNKIKNKKSKKILIAGLGLGIVTKLISMIDSVKKITVVEYSQDIIDLVSPYLKSEIDLGKIEIIHSDIHNFEPSIKYNAVWLDIWDSIGLDNKEDMIMLKQKFKKHTTVKGPVLCWSENLLKHCTE